MILITLAAVLLFGTAVRATVITVDLTQSGTESTGDITGDTWRWGGSTATGFDLEFSSGNGSNLDLDGGNRAGSDFHTGSEATTNHTYDVIRATYLMSNRWSIEAIRGSNTYWIGNVNEYSGTLSHSANYGFSASESNPVAGPSDSGAGASSPSSFKGWFWIYRNTSNQSVSLNFTVGSAVNTTPGDQGQIRGEFDFGGNYTGTARIIVMNDNATELAVDGSDPTLFRGNFNWIQNYDDGAVIGGVAPTATVPEPGTFALFGLGALALLVHRRRRSAR